METRIFIIKKASGFQMLFIKIYINKNSFRSVTNLIYNRFNFLFEKIMIAAA